MQQTLPAKVNKGKTDESSETSPLVDNAKVPEEIAPDMSIRQLLSIPAVRTVMISTFCKPISAITFVLLTHPQYSASSHSHSTRSLFCLPIHPSR